MRLCARVRGIKRVRHQPAKKRSADHGRDEGHDNEGDKKPQVNEPRFERHRSEQDLHGPTRIHCDSDSERLTLTHSPQPSAAACPQPLPYARDREDDHGESKVEAGGEVSFEADRDEVQRGEDA